MTRFGPLTLEHMNLDRVLIISSRRKNLAFVGGQCTIARDERRHHATRCLDAERQRRHIQQQNITDIAGKYPCLDGRPNGDYFVGVYPFLGFFTKKTTHSVLDGWHAGLPAHQHHRIDVTSADSGIEQGLAHGGE